MKDLIVSVLIDLKNKNYREGFTDTVLHHVVNAIREVDMEKGNRFWSYGCMLPYDKKKMIDEFMDGDESVFALYEEVEKISKGDGAFVMPEWGIRGT